MFTTRLDLGIRRKEVMALEITRKEVMDLGIRRKEVMALEITRKEVMDLGIRRKEVMELRIRRKEVMDFGSRKSAPREVLSLSPEEWRQLINIRAVYIYLIWSCSFEEASKTTD
ncbi:hypothetical protein DMENIID0001_078550 [Sergentomyia squamirostris]